MSYALQTILHEKARYAAGVGAVAFSAVLMILQVGLMLGLFELTSIPVDHTSESNVWIGSKDVKAIDLGRPIPISHIGRIGEKPGMRPPEYYIVNYAQFGLEDGSTELCFLLGSMLEDDSAGVLDILSDELRNQLTEPGTIVVDESDLQRLQINFAQGKTTATINGHNVRVIGTVKGLKSLAAPWVICSWTTARDLLEFVLPDKHTSYLLAKCDSPERANQIASELRAEYPEMTILSAQEFSSRSRFYWLTRTKAGVAIGYAALLGLLVGLVITAQTLYSATMASAREYATLLALGIPRGKIYRLVLAQAFWVGLAGIIVAYPVVHILAYGAQAAGTRVVLRWEVVLGAGVVTMGTALFAGLLALRSVRKIEPMSLLR